MNKFSAAFVKEIILLMRDRSGLLFMFLMPIVLAILITAVQSNSADLMSSHSLPVVIQNNDTSATTLILENNLRGAGLLNVLPLKRDIRGNMEKIMGEAGAMAAIVFPPGFGQHLQKKAASRADALLQGLGVADSSKVVQIEGPFLQMYFSPSFQQNYRMALRGLLNAEVRQLESRFFLQKMVQEVNPGANVDTLQELISGGSPSIMEFEMGAARSAVIPGATQHNIPAWTVFAMFFIVVSLGGSIVKEKVNGSFLRLKTIPGSFVLSLLAKQLSYLMVTILQALVIFLIGLFIFPVLSLPALQVQNGLTPLFLVCIFSGLTAISFAQCIGIYCGTLQQANSLGAVSVVILAALGGIMVPSFAMPEVFRTATLFSPLHYCLEAFYSVLLFETSAQRLLGALLPLLVLIAVMQTLAYYGLKRKQLI